MPTIALNSDGSFSPETMRAIENELYANVEEYSQEEFPSEHRTHLGASVIGDTCSRKLWYAFRWVKLEQFEGRMKRLFNRGHLEEEKFATLLTWMGFFVRTIDPNTNKQYRFSAVGGHYGGSGDSVALLPWIRDENCRVLVEYKTHNKKSFEKLAGKRDNATGKREGGLKLKIAKPQHWVQMCAYGKAFGVQYGLYCAINKDDDDLYFEFVELDWNLAIQMENKASDIITSQIPPPKLSEQPAYFECRYCTFREICHYNAKVEKNCRSCKYAKPVDNAQWHCSKFNGVIPSDFIKIGCSEHLSIAT